MTVIRCASYLDQAPSAPSQFRHRFLSPITNLLNSPVIFSTAATWPTSLPPTTTTSLFFSCLFKVILHDGNFDHFFTKKMHKNVHSNEKITRCPVPVQQQRNTLLVNTRIKQNSARIYGNNYSRQATVLCVNRNRKNRHDELASIHVGSQTTKPEHIQYT